MPLPRVVAVTALSPAARAGVAPGDEIRAMNGQVPRDVIEYHLIADEPHVELDLTRGGLELTACVEKTAGESLGIEVSSALFDRVRTCDNHCEFCFIYQLPKGMRRSLYLKDDDYRLSFLYGNFTTLTRFTEADLERVISERLSPLFVSIHATDPALRARMLRNPRGATSLRWLRQLLDNGIEVHGQIVVCPGVNDGAVLEDTLAGILDTYPEMASAAAVPLGISRYTNEPRMRAHERHEAEAVVSAIGEWQEVFLGALGRRMIHAADEYYLMAGAPFPDVAAYEGFPQHENGIGMARSFEAAFLGEAPASPGVRHGFFAWVDGAPAEGYRALRVTTPSGARAAAAEPPGSSAAAPSPVRIGHRGSTTIVTGEYGARVLEPLLDAAGVAGVQILPVKNDFFGGNTAVTGLLTGEDLARTLAGEPDDRRYLLPDVCLSGGRFLDGLTLEALPRTVEVIGSDGASLRRALGLAPIAAAGSSAAAGSGTAVLVRAR
jgi:putative radical SAM enzyme (TIGR03279 family)